METTMIGATIGSALIGGISANKAANAQKKAADDQVALSREIYEDQTQRFSPYSEDQTNALQAYLSTVGLGDAPEGYSGLQMSEGAKYMMDAGRDSVESGAAGRGGLYSGAAMAGLEKMRAGIAANDRDNQQNRLLGLAQMGQSSAGMQAQAGGQFASNTNNALANYGNAAAAGATGVGNAVQNGISNGLQLWQYGQGQQNNAYGG